MILSLLSEGGSDGKGTSFYIPLLVILHTEPYLSLGTDFSCICGLNYSLGDELVCWEGT